MNPAAFIDTNIPIYAAGSAHPLKEPCTQILLLVAENPQGFITNAEVLQELLHRYLALGRWRQGREVFRRFNDLMVGRIETINAFDVQKVAILADTYPELGGRDLLHLAVMQRLDLHGIVSADAGFDRLPGLERLDPAYLPNWRHSVLP